MLKHIRHEGFVKTLAWIIAIIIIISFGFLGTAYLIQDQNRKRYAGEIFGEKIGLEAFQKHYQAVNINALIQYGDRYYDVREYLNLGSQTWDRLILLHEAEKQNIQITDQEVVDAVQKYNFFRKNNAFDPELYNQILSNVFKVSPRVFEESTRDTLKLSKMVNSLTQDIKADDATLFDAFKNRQEKVQVSYALLAPDAFKDQVQISDSDIDAYYKENKLDFIMPESINLEYVAISFPQGANADEKAAIRQKADELLTQLSSGNSDAALKSAGLSLTETGFFSKENPKMDLSWPMESLNAVFTLTAGEWFGPFENDAKVFLTRLKERRDAYMPELAEIQDKVKNALLKEKGLELAKTKMQEYLTTIKTAPDITAAVRNLGLELTQTPEFVRGQYLPKIGIQPEVQEAAFKLSETNKISDVIHTDIGSFILVFEKYIPASREEFEKVKKQIEQDFLNMKKNEMFTTFLAKLRAQSNFKDYIQEQQKEE